MADGARELHLRTAQGLDLGDPRIYGDVRRLFFRRFSARTRGAGWEEEDAFQEVLLRLVRRQSGRSRFDPARSSLSNYLYIAMTGICANLAELQRRRRDEVIGVPARRRRVGGPAEWEGEAADWSDAASAAVGATCPISPRMVDDLAAEMEIPRAVVEALLLDEDPVLAAIDAGMAARDAIVMGDALGVR